MQTLQKVFQKVTDSYTTSKAKSIIIPGEQKYQSNPNINLVTSGPQQNIENIQRMAPL